VRRFIPRIELLYSKILPVIVDSKGAFAMIIKAVICQLGFCYNLAKGDKNSIQELLGDF
jgi:hypothetical protein